MGRPVITTIFAFKKIPYVSKNKTNVLSISSMHNDDSMVDTTGKTMHCDWLQQHKDWFWSCRPALYKLQLCYKTQEDGLR